MRAYVPPLASENLRPRVVVEAGEIYFSLRRDFGERGIPSREAPKRTAVFLQVKRQQVTESYQPHSIGNRRSVLDLRSQVEQSRMALHYDGILVNVLTEPFAQRAVFKDRKTYGGHGTH